MTWQDRAACNADPNFLSLRPFDAAAFCARRCPVLEPCLRAALEEERGVPSFTYLATVRGGLTPSQRLAMIRARERTEAA